MKRKILVLLLALTLALSLTPMMAFADDGTEDPASANETANEIAEENKTQDEAPVKADNAADNKKTTDADRETFLSHKVKMTRLINGNKPALKSRKTAVKRGPQICTHPSTYTEYWYDEDYCIFTDRGNDHEVTGEIEEATICKKCGDTLDVKDLGYTTKTERHYYWEGVCYYCQHENTCSHPYIGSYYNPDEDEDCKIIDRGDYHELNGWIDEIIYCEECEELLDIEVFENMTVDVEHFFNSGGVCEECGHLNDDTRLYGHSRCDTAVTVANRYQKISGAEKFENVVVAYGLDYPDALSGGYLAKVKNAPILLVYASESVEDDIVDYISRNIADEGTVYILGGTGVVSSSFENKLVQKGIKKKRLGGKDRYETNLKILEEAGVNAEELLVCTGKDYADSLSASAAGKPILLVGDALTDIQMKYIEKLNPEKIFLIGGKGVVSDTIETELADYDTERLSGKDRFATSKAVAEEFFPETNTVVLVYALDFPDGLSGGPLAMLEDAPIILTDSKNTEKARAYVKSVGATNNFTLGGPALISDRAVDVIMGD